MDSGAGTIAQPQGISIGEFASFGKKEPMTDAEFERFVRENQDGALRLAYSYLKDWDEAKDAVQDAFVKAYRNASAFRGDSSEKTWFYRIMVNQLKDALRRKKVREIVTSFTSVFSRDGEDAVEIEPKGDAPGPEEKAEAAGIRRDFDKALQKLPARQRQVASLYLNSGLTLKQAAETLGISEGAAKAHYFRAVRALREELSSWRDTP